MAWLDRVWQGALLSVPHGAGGQNIVAVEFRAGTRLSLGPLAYWRPCWVSLRGPSASPLPPPGAKPGITAGVWLLQVPAGAGPFSWAPCHPVASAFLWPYPGSGREQASHHSFTSAFGCLGGLFSSGHFPIPNFHPLRPPEWDLGTTGLVRAVQPGAAGLFLLTLIFLRPRSPRSAMHQPPRT